MLSKRAAFPAAGGEKRPAGLCGVGRDQGSAPWCCGSGPDQGWGLEGE